MLDCQTPSSGSVLFLPPREPTSSLHFFISYYKQIEKVEAQIIKRTLDWKVEKMSEIFLFITKNMPHFFYLSHSRNKHTKIMLKRILECFSFLEKIIMKYFKEYKKHTKRKNK